MTKSFLNTLILLFVAPTFGFSQKPIVKSSQAFKKIKNIRTNNPVSLLDQKIALRFTKDSAYLGKLREYVEKKGLKVNLSEGDLSIISSVMSWVTKQWEHDGMGGAPAGYTALETLKDVHEKNK